MTDGPQARILSRKGAEIGFAVVLAGVGLAVVQGAREMDTGWGSSGPEAGYFPLRIGLLIIAGALVILVREALRPDRLPPLLVRRAGGQLLRFIVPLVAFIAAIPVAGLYLAAAAYLLVAVGVVGRIPLPRTMAIAAVTPAIAFVTFEIVFRTPLPKGPLGPLLGFP